ncbi:MAG: hypothetical protein PHX83_13285 [Acidobacteriia bacterium]|nr:hypothetical protein [Terriglobia bacterium]
MFHKIQLSRVLRFVVFVLALLCLVKGAVLFSRSKSQDEPQQTTITASQSAKHAEAKGAHSPAARGRLSLQIAANVHKAGPSERQKIKEQDPVGPNLPKGMREENEEVSAQQLRDADAALRRGVEPGFPYDPDARSKAIRQMQEQESHLATAGPTWTVLGPFTIPNGGLAPGQTPAPVSGRVTSIAIDPTDSNKVYIGTAQGGVWRSTDGGTTWAPIFDNAQSLAIGALAIAPSSPGTLYVGTGEGNMINQGTQPGGAQSFFGVGLYRVDNADTTATLVGPINPQITVSGLTYNVFAGRSISKILVHPTSPGTIFVSTTSGFAGSSGTQLAGVPPMATLGLYRSINATADAGSVAFQKLVVSTSDSVDSPPTGNDSISDMVMEPGNPNNIIVGVMQGPGGNAYRSTNALAATPTFTQVLGVPGAPGWNLGVRMIFAINKVGSKVTVYVASGENPTSGCGAPGSGAARMSDDGGATWSNQVGGQGFCGAQCYYSMAMAVNPNDQQEVFLAGGKHDSCGGEILQKASGGGGLVRDDSGLHVDTHAIAYDSAGNVFIGNDGGIWKRPAGATAGSPWTNLNTAPLNTLQFEGLAVHPTDRNFTVAGTQDNGTEYQVTSPGNWRNAETGDGGYVLIDQNSTDTNNVIIYHNFSHLRPGDGIGFDRIVNTSCFPVQDSWPVRGDFGGSTSSTPACDGTAFYTHNGLNRSNNSLVYAPMALGPGNPNTLYYGTDRLYRSSDRGDTMTVVSQGPISSDSLGGVPLSTIAVSPQDDNYRLVGLKNGQVWGTSTGSSTLVSIGNGPFPANPSGSSSKFVGRAAFDPGNKDVAYIVFSFYAPAGQGVFKISNFGAAAGSSPTAPVWTAAGTGIPSIPINSFVVDPSNSNDLFAGTDIGVYNSTDGGVTWNPYGTGLPRVPVFDMAIQNSNRLLRIATFGRGIWEAPIQAQPAPHPTQVNVPGSGAGIFSTSGSAVNVKAGSAVVTSGPGNPAYGTAVFSLTQNGVVVSEVGVPASPPTTHGRIFIDFRSGVAAKGNELDAGTINIDTGMALVNRGNATAHIAFNVQDSTGIGIPGANGGGTLAVGAHTALFIDQLNTLAPGFNLPSNFPTATKFGSLDITSDQPLSILALRSTTNQRSDVLLTSTPVVDMTQSPGSGPMLFAQFADGGGFTTLLILLNPTNAVESGTLHFFLDNGTPLTVQAVGGTSNSTFPYNIPANGVFVLQTDGSPAAIHAGSVQVIPDPGSTTPAGAGVFSLTQGGILVTQSGVPSATSTTHAHIYVDESNTHDTGLAIANPSGTARSVTLAAFQTDGVTPSGSSNGPVNLAGNGHTAAFVGQFISNLPPGFTGVLDISSTQPFVALTLRSLVNTRGDTLLTTFPIADFFQTPVMPLVFPQIADGGGFKTQFIFLNTNGSASSLALSFFGDDGSAMSLSKSGR